MIQFCINTCIYNDMAHIFLGGYSYPLIMAVDVVQVGTGTTKHLPSLNGSDKQPSTSCFLFPFHEKHGCSLEKKIGLFAKNTSLCQVSWFVENILSHFSQGFSVDAQTGVLKFLTQVLARFDRLLFLFSFYPFCGTPSRGWFVWPVWKLIAQFVV